MRWRPSTPASSPALTSSSPTTLRSHPGPQTGRPYGGNRTRWPRRCAIRSSGTFQRVAVLLGPDRERAYLERLEYGNRDASSGPTTFWLDEGLRISPEEQEKLLVRLYEDALPVSKAAMRTVRQILVQPAGVVVNALGEHPFDAPWPEGTTVGAKTGTADNVTWLVGSVQRGGRSWVFVSCVMAPSARDPLAAIRLGATSLREAGVL
jgi:beta-lactamase class D